MSTENGSKQPRENKKEGGGILMFIILIFITIAIILTTWTIYEMKVQENVEVLNITLTVYDGELDTEFDRWDSVESDYLPYVQNISSDAVLEQGMVSSVEAPEDTPLQLPGIVVRAFDADTGNVISYWTSALYEGPDTYEITLNFIEPPEKGDNMRIIFEIVNSQGDDIFPYHNHDLANSFIIYVWE